MKSTSPFIFFCLLFGSSAAWSNVTPIFQSATSKGTGATGRAAVEPIDAISLNPATLAHLQGRHFSVSSQQKTFAVGLSDNTKESMIPGGIAYVKRNLGDTPELSSQDFRVSLAEFFLKKWAVGLSAHYTDIKTDTKLYNQVNGDLGVTYIINSNFGLAAVAYDLAPVSKDIPENLRNEPKFGVGAYGIYKEFFRLRGDITSNLAQKSNLLSYGLGAESYLESWLVFRAGIARDDLYQETWGSLGLGFLGPRFYINYSWEKTVARAEIVEDRNLHSIDLGIPF